MPSYPKNYPFYNWVPKPLGILIMLLLFIPILTVGGVYSVNSTEMMSGLGIISEHIQFTNFVTSIGMAAFAPFLPADVHSTGEDDVPGRIFAHVCLQLYLRQDGQHFFAGALQSADGLSADGADDG